MLCWIPPILLPVSAPCLPMACRWRWRMELSTSSIPKWMHRRSYTLFNITTAKSLIPTLPCCGIRLEHSWQFPFEPPSTPPSGPLHLAYMTDDCIGLVRIAPQQLMQASWIMDALPPDATTVRSRAARELGRSRRLGRLSGLRLWTQWARESICIVFFPTDGHRGTQSELRLRWQHLPAWRPGVCVRKQCLVSAEEKKVPEVAPASDATSEDEEELEDEEIAT